MARHNGLRGSEAPLTAWPWIAALMLLHVLAAPWSTVIVDTARDLYWATRIADGIEWPLRGPVVYYVGNLSPLWFFVLAPVVWATHSQAAVALFVALLSALKFPLAYVLGREIGGRRLGLILAALLALPSWSIVQLMVTTHTNLVEPLVLLFGLCLWRWRTRADGRWLALAGLAFGLGVNAHPTVVVLALPAALVWLGALRAGRADWGWLALGAVLALAPFLPVLLAEWREGWPVLAKLATYVGERTGELGLARYGATLAGALFGGIAIVANHWVGDAARYALWGLYGALFALAAIGVLRALIDGRQTRLVAALFVLVLLLPALLAASRPGVVAYMLYHWQPLLALLLALGLIVFARGRHGARVAHGIAGAALLLSASATLALIGRAEQGYVAMPIAQLGTIERFDFPVEGVGLLPAYRADRIGAALCTTPRPPVFHADLALLMESNLAFGARWRCGEGRARVIGGATEGEADHWLGLPPRVMDELGIEPTARLGGWPLARAQRVLHPPASQPIPDGSRYPPRPAPGPTQDLVLRFDTAPGARVLVANPINHVAVLSHIAARADNRELAGRALTNVSTLLHCPECDADRDGRLRWELTLSTNAPELTDVLVIDGDGRGGAAGN